jgi:probable DNA metabolism protein
MAGHYRYDGTVAGLLTLLARLLPDRIQPDAISVEPPAQTSLFAGVVEVDTDEEVAAAFWGELEGRLPPSGLQQLRLALLAEQPERELIICRYCRLVWQQGKGAGAMLAHPQVAPLWKLARQVGREAHRWIGFVRFREVRERFY